MNSLFERIHIKDRKVIGYIPRMDRANRVRMLIGTAFDYEYGWSERDGTQPVDRTNHVAKRKTCPNRAARIAHALWRIAEVGAAIAEARGTLAAR